jgi:hypothetical protein
VIVTVKEYTGLDVLHMARDIHQDIVFFCQIFAQFSLLPTTGLADRQRRPDEATGAYQSVAFRAVVSV